LFQGLAHLCWSPPPLNVFISPDISFMLAHWCPASGWLAFHTFNLLLRVFSSPKSLSWALGKCPPLPAGPFSPLPPSPRKFLVLFYTSFLPFFLGHVLFCSTVHPYPFSASNSKVTPFELNPLGLRPRDSLFEYISPQCPLFFFFLFGISRIVPVGFFFFLCFHNL